MNRPDDDSLNERGGDPKVVEAAAIRLLARREHSTDELRRKLLARRYDERIVTAVIEKLRSKRLISDDRFAASFAHHHAQRGQGPVRIRTELRQHGLEDPLIESGLAGTEVDWVQRAKEVRRRRFGSDLPWDARERAKQARFLQYRGFSADQIRAALRGDRSDEPFAVSDDGTDDSLD